MAAIAVPFYATDMAGSRALCVAGLEAAAAGGGYLTTYSGLFNANMRHDLLAQAEGVKKGKWGQNSSIAAFESHECVVAEVYVVEGPLPKVYTCTPPNAPQTT